MPDRSSTRNAVLIVEDSLTVGRRLAELLNETGTVDVVGPALDGREALDLFGRFRPSAVILDLQLPDRNGLELIPTFREARPPCVIVVLTNFDQPEFRARSLGAGADYFLSKSEEFEQVADIVGRLEGTRA